VIIVESVSGVDYLLQSSTKVDVEEKIDEPLRIFEGSPVEKFFRPESERRPEAGNTDPNSVMKFDGPAPETINSRLAMLGLTWALVAEIVTGQSLIQQVSRAEIFGHNLDRYWSIGSQSRQSTGQFGHNLDKVLVNLDNK
jgi:hypothetical protein